MASGTTRKTAATNTPPGGWESWGQHVLSELERLSHAVESVREKVTELSQDARVVQHETDLIELKKWRRAHDDVATPMQLAKKLDTVEELKATQIKAYAILAVVQVAATGFGGLLLYLLKS